MGKDLLLWRTWIGAIEISLDPTDLKLSTKNIDSGIMNDTNLARSFLWLAE